MPEAKVPGLDHPDASKDWGHGVTVEKLDPACKNKMDGMEQVILGYSNIYKVNPALIVAIANLESGYGTSNAIRNKNNPMGYMDIATNCSTLKQFPSLQEGFRVCISNLSRNYIAKGKNRIEDIAKIYSPPGAANDIHGTNAGWPGNVRKIFREITGTEYNPSMAGPGVKNEQLDPVEGGLNGGIAGDGTGSPGPNFDNREDWENLTEVKGAILSFMIPEHMYSVEGHVKEWEKEKYDREFHFGIDSEGLVALKSDKKIAKSMQDNNMSTYINRALFQNKAIKNCISIALFTSSETKDYQVTEKRLIKDVARILHKYCLETKDLWREFDLNRAASPLIYLERETWKKFLKEVDKQLTFLKHKYPQQKSNDYEGNVGKTCTIKSATASLLDLPEQGARVVSTLQQGEQHKIKAYSNTWYQLESPEGWIEVRHVEVPKDTKVDGSKIPMEKVPTLEDKKNKDDKKKSKNKDKKKQENKKDKKPNESDDLPNFDVYNPEGIPEEVNIEFPKIDENLMPEVTNVLTHDEYVMLLNYGNPARVDNYAGWHEPYDKNLPEIIDFKITDDERLASMTTQVTSLEENEMYYVVIEASPGDGDHCKRASAEMSALWKPQTVKVEPIYPDLIIPPKYSTTDQNVSDPNALPPGVFSSTGVIDDYIYKSHKDENGKESEPYKITMFDYTKVKEKQATKGKPVNYNDPYPYDDKIYELERHSPKVKIDEIESRLYDCNHIGCPIGQPMAKNFHMLNNALIAQSKRMERRLVKIENTLSLVLRNLGRLGSRMHINCVYYGGQDTFGKYKTIRCLKDDRIEDGCSVTIDQCMACNRFEPVLGQIYEILDATGINGAYVSDDEQMSYNNAIDFNKLEHKSFEDYANLADNSKNEEYKSLIEMWKEVDKKAFEEDLKKKYKGEELDKKLKELKEHEYLFKMDWDEVELETQEPDVKKYPLEGIKAQYKVKPLSDKGLDEQDKEKDKKIEENKSKEKERLKKYARRVNVVRTRHNVLRPKHIVSLKGYVPRTNISSSTTTTGKIANANISAYYPANNSMEGGFIDAQGNKLDYTKNTCAAPKEIPFGTKIKILGTNTERDGQIYTVTDRGGAIVYNPSTDTYKIDLLVKDRAAAMAWGRKYGKIEIGATSPGVSGGTTSGGGILSKPSGPIEDVPLPPYVDKDNFGDNDVDKDKADLESITAGDWVDTREDAETYEINKYTSEEFFFEGFGTNINASTSGTSNTNILGESSSVIRNKITELALKIVDDHVTRKKAFYDNDKRTCIYEADKPDNKDKTYYYDCSSLVSCCYNYAGLVDFTNGTTKTILDQARKQGALMWPADEEGIKKALPGDVILFGKGEGGNFVPSHCAIYLKDKEFAHAAGHYGHPKEIKHDKDFISSFKNYTRYFCRSAELDKKDKESASVLGTGQFTWPVPSSKRVTSGFGMRTFNGKTSMHNGIDIGSDPAGQHETPIVAADAGTIIKAGPGTGYGKVIYLDHGNGYVTRYAHLNSFKVDKGAKVTKGQHIAGMGNTGVGVGVHLHFEIRKDDKPLDPQKFFIK